MPKDPPLSPLADILPPPLPALIQLPGSLSESWPRELRELTWTVLNECRYEYRFTQNLVPYCSRLVERLGEAYLKSGADEALLRMGELVERVVSVNLPLKSTGAVDGSSADPHEARQKEVLELVAGSAGWQWLTERAASGQGAGKGSSAVDSQESGAAAAGAAKPAAQNPDLVESKTDASGGPSSAPSRQVTGNVGVSPSFSPFNTESQPIRLPADLPAHWSGPLRASCREVLVKARRLLAPRGTVNNLVFYCQVVVNWLSEQPLQTLRHQRLDLPKVGFCREFGRNAISEMAELVPGLLGPTFATRINKHGCSKSLERPGNGGNLLFGQQVLPRTNQRNLTGSRSSPGFMGRRSLSRFTRPSGPELHSPLFHLRLLHRCFQKVHLQRNEGPKA